MGNWSLSWVRRRSGCGGDSGQSIRAWGRESEAGKEGFWMESGPVWGMRAPME